MRKTYFFLLATLLNILNQAAAQDIDPKLGKVLDSFGSKETKETRKQVWIFKQWHLAPNTNTKDDTKTAHPQEENQTAIFIQLDRWISERKLDTVFAEGCSGKIENGFSAKFNGWTLEDLKQQSKTKNFERIVTMVPLKLEAKHGENVQTICADDDSLVRQQGLAFSDARGLWGYYSRLKQYQKDPARAKPYLADVIQLEKLDSQTTAAQALMHLKLKLRQTVARIHTDIEARNKKMADVISKASGKNMAIVIGGMHADGLAKLLKKNGVSVSVVQPTGYSIDSEKAVKELDKMIDAL